MYNSLKSLSLNVSYETVVNNLANEYVDIKSLFGSSKEIAFKEVQKLGLPNKIHLKKELSGLGPKASKLYIHKYKMLSQEYGKNLAKFVGFANIAFHSSVVAGNCFFVVGIKCGEILDNQFTKKLTTFDGYIESEGAANTMMNYTASLSFIEAATKLFPCFKEHHLLYAIGLLWLNEVEQSYIDSKILDIDFLTEAFDCFELANGSWMWYEGYQSKVDEIISQRKKAAAIRHSENYALKDQVREYYVTHDLHLLKIERATSIVFSKNLVPVAYRTIRGWISEFSKLQSA